MDSDTVSEVVGSNAQQLGALFGLKNPVEGEALYRRIIDALGVSESIKFATVTGLSLLPSGADSRAIIKVDGDFPFVIKVGAARIVENERRFLDHAGAAFREFWVMEATAMIDGTLWRQANRHQQNVWFSAT